MPKDDLNAIRRLTRITLPDDETYIYRLGIALYTFASFSNFMMEIAAHLDSSLNRTELQSKIGGQLLDEFRKCLKMAKTDTPAIGSLGQFAADMFETLNTQLSDIIHAYPITNGEGSQIL